MSLIPFSADDDYVMLRDGIALVHGWSYALVLRYGWTHLLLLLFSPAICVSQQRLPPPEPVEAFAPGEDPARALLSASDPLLQQGRAETAPLSLGDLESLAFQYNPTLAAARSRMTAARGRQEQAGLYPNPTIGYHGTEIGNLGTAGQQGAFVSQRFITGHKLRLDQAIAAREVDEAHFRFHAQEQRVLTDVRVRFYEALAAARRVEVGRDLAQISNDVVKATGTLVENRLRTENDLLQAEIRADEAHLLLANAEHEWNEAWRRLMAVIGTPTLGMTALHGDLAGDLRAYVWEEAQRSILTSQPELSAARMRAARARTAIERATREPIPNVDLMVSARHVNPTSSDVANVQVGIPIPIFNRNQGNIRAAEADWIAACRDVERVELELQDRLAIVYRRYANAREQVDYYRARILPRAERSLKLVTEGYENGQVDYLTMLIAQQTYAQVNLAYIHSLRELRAATAVIDGQLLEGSLTPRP